MLTHYIDTLCWQSCISRKFFKCLSPFGQKYTSMVFDILQKYWTLFWQSYSTCTYNINIRRPYVVISRIEFNFVVPKEEGTFLTNHLIILAILNITFINKISLLFIMCVHEMNFSWIQHNSSCLYDWWWIPVMQPLLMCSLQ